MNQTIHHTIEWAIVGLIIGLIIGYATIGFYYDQGSQKVKESAEKYVFENCHDVTKVLEWHYKFNVSISDG